MDSSVAGILVTFVVIAAIVAIVTFARRDPAAADGLKITETADRHDATPVQSATPVVRTAQIAFGVFYGLLMYSAVSALVYLLVLAIR